MAKGCLSFIAYPDCTDPDKITDIELIADKLRERGAQCAYILHDKDVYLADNPRTGKKAGESEKPHYHILAGWEIGFPKWADFVKWMASCNVYIESPEKCIVTDTQAIEDYLTHSRPQDANKHQYPLSAVHFDAGWASCLYQKEDIRRDKVRKEKKNAKLTDSSKVIDLINFHDIRDFSSLIDLVISDHNELYEVCQERAYYLKQYLHDRANKRQYEDIDKEFRERRKLEDDFEFLRSQFTNRLNERDALIHDLINYIDRLVKLPDDDMLFLKLKSEFEELQKHSYDDCEDFIRNLEKQWQHDANSPVVTDEE